MKFSLTALAWLLGATPVFAQIGLGAAINTATQIAAEQQRAQAEAARQNTELLIQILAAKRQADLAAAANAASAREAGARQRLFTNKAMAVLNADADSLRIGRRVLRQYYDVCNPLLNDLYIANPMASMAEISEALAGPREEFRRKTVQFSERYIALRSFIADSVHMSSRSRAEFTKLMAKAVTPLFYNDLDTPTWDMRIAIDTLIPRFAGKSDSPSLKKTLSRKRAPGSRPL